jgi:hypothetical protein
MRGSNIIYTVEDINNIIELHKQGYTVPQISVKLRELGRVIPIKSIAKKIWALGLYNENKIYKK